MGSHKYRARHSWACTKCQKTHPKGTKTCVARDCDGDVVFFASQGEFKRFTELRLLQQAGLIDGLVIQPSYNLAINNVHICRYVADFAYSEGSKWVVEDFKGVQTKIFKLKARLMLAIHGIKVFVSK